MKSVYLGIVLACSLGLAAAAQASPQPSHEEHAGNAASMPVPAQRYATDAPLREGMARVRTALDELRHYEMGHMPRAMALQRVDTIEEAVRTMFSHCKLAPNADAALHSMLVPLLAGAQALKKNPADIAAIAAMRAAVANFPRYFDYPQWPAVTAPTDAAHAGL